ncbi:MAG TPA: indolepyruvate ferredoxin oxidoreductase family protein [Oceanospirillaceae bacterium]|nr:indolepyruvate ferredoxin oxidoreductase family protein [Oceanospirillaceae bacterium]
MTIPLAHQPEDLFECYRQESGQVYMSGVQALARIPMAQVRRDKAAGLNTGGFISGYRGSPLGLLDKTLQQAQAYLEQHNIRFQPGVNEELAATMVWGSQQLHLSKDAKFDGLVGMWYGKGPGVDRCGDVFKHANAAGSAPHGGVLCVAGDDHGAKSSTVPHQSDHAFMSSTMPVLYPSSIHEYIWMGLAGIAMSRYSGCWVGFKVISETVETTAAVNLAHEDIEFVIPDDFDIPSDGLNLRWPDDRMQQDSRLQNHKGYAALAFARANGFNRVTLASAKPRFGIVASGKSYEETRQAIHELGLTDQQAAQMGISVYKVGMPWPLEPQGIRAFSEGLEEILIVEERREMIENQIKQQLFNWRTQNRPRIIGKFDELDRSLLPLDKELDVPMVAKVIAQRLLKLDLDLDTKAHLTAQIARIDAQHAASSQMLAPVSRTPYFCAGCPHNTSTKVPEGSRAAVGIGCHFMVQWMDRNTETFSQMGGEGTMWAGCAHFTDEAHQFVNLGDGTYFHSGSLAIRQSLAAGANITYKILYNDAVAMTGGQSVDGNLSMPQITHQLYHEGVQEIIVLADNPSEFKQSELAQGTYLGHRDELEPIMLRLREQQGLSVIVFQQTCATEKRRLRKQGKVAAIKTRAWIHPEICEGCGDCSVQSNCVAIEPLDTNLGRKRKINQSSCNADLSCVKGFCPSFITIEGAQVRKPKAQSQELMALPEPAPHVGLEQPFNIAVTGVGGTGVLTIGALLGMAAHLDGNAFMTLDFSGLAQKGGAVLSHVRLAATPEQVTTPRIVEGRADLLLAADAVVTVAPSVLGLCSQNTQAVISSHLIPVSNFVQDADFEFKQDECLDLIASHVSSQRHQLDFHKLALQQMGDTIFANVMLLGFAVQKGLVPVSIAALEQAVQLNGVAIDANLRALHLGRQLAHRGVEQPQVLQIKPSAPSYEDILTDRAQRLVSYQNQALADRYTNQLGRWQQLVDDKSTTNLSQSLKQVLASSYFKLLAVKDEYEVARLFSQPGFKAQLDKEFSGNYKLSLNLSPLGFAGWNKNLNQPNKYRMGSWMLKLMKPLSLLKGIRGTAIDPYSYHSERQAERAFVGYYVAQIERLLEQLDATNAAQILATIKHFDKVRGYGYVRAESMAAAKTQVAAELRSFSLDEQAYAA